MCYKVKIFGKIFEGRDTRILIRLAVAARKEAIRQTNVRNNTGVAQNPDSVKY